MSSLSRKFVAAGFAGVFGVSMFSNCAVATNPMKIDNPPTGEKKCVICNRKFKIASYIFLFVCCGVLKFVILPKLQAAGKQTEEQKKDENNNSDGSTNVGDIPDEGDAQTKEDNQEQIDDQKSGMSNGTKALIGGGVVLGTAAVGTGIAAAIKSKQGNVDIGKTEDSGPYMFLGNSNATSMANTGSSVDIAKGAELNGYSKNEATEQHVVYIVKSGDTLSEIAQKYGTSVSDLAKKNNIKDVNLIYPNQSITIR